MSIPTAAASRITTATLRRMKPAGQRIVCLTAYDATFAACLERAGVEVVLVGDSLGMVIQGHPTTLPVRLRDMVYHTRCVARGCQWPLLMADMPFMSYQSPAQACKNAARLLRAGAQMVKLEAGKAQAGIVRALSEQGMPVCAHLGLRPQSIHKLGAYRVQGRDEAQARAMVDQAQDLEQAGTDLLLLECVPASLAAEIAQVLSIPVIGIGAGPQCDGQILVLQDVLGITVGKTPRFAHNFMQGASSIPEALAHYVAAVKQGAFPAAENTF